MVDRHDPNLPNLHGARDPRGSHGDIAGPGGPYDQDAVVVDTTNAVILDYSTVSLIGFVRGDQEDETGVGLMLEGRINRTQDRTRVLYLMNGDGAAAIVTELLGVAKRAERRAGQVQQAPMARPRGQPRSVRTMVSVAVTASSPPNYASASANDGTRCRHD